MSEPPTGAEPPICISIVLCNEVIEDKRTNNKTLVSLFNSILSPQLPTTHPRMFVMASLTSGRGRWPVRFRITDPAQKEIARMDGEAVFTDPLGVLDIVCELRGLPLTQEGVHFIDVSAGGTHLSERRFTVQLVAAQPPGGQ